MDRRVCKVCKKKLVEAVGNKSAKFLLVGEFPGYQEIIEGRAFVGRTGEVLQAELSKAGMALQECRLTNLWLHEKDEKNCNVETHLNEMVKEFKGKTHILLMGSDVVRALLGQSVMNLSGTRLKLPVYKNIHFWVSPNPAVVFRSPVGELRMAMERFVKDARR